MLPKVKKNYTLELGNTYAVQNGAYAGEMLVYVGKELYNYNFLAVPTMLNRSIPSNSFDLAWNTGIIEFVEQVPDYVTQISVTQYNENEKLNNRRE
jgi:hypothetical protein